MVNIRIFLVLKSLAAEVSRDNFIWSEIYKFAIIYWRKFLSKKNEILTKKITFYHD